MENFKNAYCYEYPRPALTVDIVVYSYFENKLSVLLIERDIEPFKGCWALPGGFVNENENVEQAVDRELLEETNLNFINRRQFYFASEPGRDPRGWTVSSVFIGYIGDKRFEAKAGDDAVNLNWFHINKLPELAFDHQQIVDKSKKQLIEKTHHSIIDRELLPPVFSLSDAMNLQIEAGNTKLQADIIVKRLLKYGVYTKVDSEFFKIDTKIYEYIREFGFE